MDADNEAVNIINETKSIFHVDEILGYFTPSNILRLILTVLVLVIFFLVYRFLKKVLTTQSKKRLNDNASYLIGRGITYTFYVIMVMYIMGLFGIDLKAVWGAAGITGLALAFAAQTTVSNVISGIFVLTEQSIKIGDFIEVNNVKGTVDHIGLLSIRIHTLDNQMIRIPTSDVINNNMINYSYFSVRRIVYEIKLSYDTDLDKALEIFYKVPSMCKTVIKKPAPLIYFDGLDNGVIVKICMWINSNDLFDAKTEGFKTILKVCNDNRLNIIATKVDVDIKQS